MRPAPDWSGYEGSMDIDSTAEGFNGETRVTKTSGKEG